MFEYLMPLLFTRTFANSLLDEACRQAVKQQIHYGRERGVPWGISESAYSALDANQIYQYRAFGVPGLGLETRAGGGPGGRALCHHAGAAWWIPPLPSSNLEQLWRKSDLGGPHGLLRIHRLQPGEPPRGRTRRDRLQLHGAPPGHEPAGAGQHAAGRQVMQRRFHADLRIRAVESLLFERVPLIVAGSGRDPRLRPVLTQPATEEDRTGRPRLDCCQRDARGSPARERQVFADGDQLRRRILPLRRFRPHPLASGYDAGPLGHVHLYPRRAIRPRLVHHLPSGGQPYRQILGPFCRGPCRSSTGTCSVSKPSRR